MKKFNTLKSGLGNGLIVRNCNPWDSKSNQLDQELTDLKWRNGIIEGTEGFFLASTNKWEFTNEDEVKPHCFPLSALVEPIRVEGYNNGKEFVPITHLFSAHLFLQYPLVKWSITDGYIDEIWLETKSGVTANVSFNKREWKLMDLWHFNTEGLSPDEFIDARESKVYEPK